MEEIFFNEGRLCISLTQGSINMKGFELPRQKQSAMLYHQGDLIDIDWQSVQVIDGRICLTFMPSPLLDKLPLPSSQLCDSLRPRALNLINDLSIAIQKAGSRVSLSFNSLPLSSFWFFENGDILLLCAQIADIIDYFHLDNQRFEYRERWYAHNCVNNFGYAHFLFQLVYYSLTGVAPFESPSVRETGFIPVPMQYFFAKDNVNIQGLCSEVNKALRGYKRIMFNVKDPFEYFRQAISNSTQNLTAKDMDKDNNPMLEEYEKRKKRNADIRIFWRKKGLILIFAILGIAAVLGIAGFYIYQAVRAPITKDLNEEEIIFTYYNAMNNLDVELMTEPLKHGYDGPDYLNATTVYVTSQMQTAYGEAKLIQNAQTWVDEGKPSLPQNGRVFGVSDVSVKKVTEDIYEASFLRYSDEDLENNDELEFSAYEGVAESITIYVYKETVRFTFQTRKTWREVTQIESIAFELDSTIEVPYHEVERSSDNLAPLALMSSPI